MDPTLPFIDLHRHLDGNVRLQTILDLGREHGIKLPGDTIETLRPHVQVEGVMPDLISWLNKLQWMIAVLGDYDACRRIARENVEDAHAEGLDYVELRFSPYFMAGPNQLDPARVVEAVVAGVEEGRAKTGLKVKLIGILSRTFGPEACKIELEALLRFRSHITALDLAGDEKNWPAGLFVEHFQRGRDAGWAITVHAGEAGGAPSVWAALRSLGATRIGHGIRAIDDAALLDHLAEHRVGLEINLTSNDIILGVRGRDHPLRAYLAAGVPVTLSTDDEGVSRSEMTMEYVRAAQDQELGYRDLKAMVRASLRHSFAEEPVKSRLLQQLDTVFVQFEARQMLRTTPR